MNKVLIEDFEYILSRNIEFNRFKNRTVLITGATGLIGSNLAKFFMYLNSSKNLNINIILSVRNKEKALKYFGHGECKIIVSDIINNFRLDDTNIDYIFHCASVTTSQEMAKNPVGVTQSIINGTQHLFENIKNKNIKSIVYLSSMEVYGKIESGFDKINEEMLGEIELSNIRSCYPLSKRMAENICYSYYVQYNTPVKIARLVQTFGAGVSVDDNRVFMQFIRSSIEERDIELHTKGDSYTNICYLADSLYGLIFIALMGENGQTYNVANESNFLTILDLANITVDKFGKNKTKIVTKLKEESNKLYPKPTQNHISAQKLRSLGWSPKFNMDETLERLFLYLTTLV